MAASMCIQAASTKAWSQFRNNARAALKSNSLDEAVEDYALAMQEAEKAFHGTDLRYINTAYEAAELNRSLRHYDAAISIYLKALDRLAKPKSGEAIYRSLFLEELGKAYLFSRQLEKAEETFNSAIEFTKKHVGDRNPLVAECFSGLAQARIDRKDYESAFPLLKQALEIAQSPELSRFDSNLFSGRGREYQPVLEAGIENSLGIAYGAKGDYAEAEKWLTLALANRERRKGKDDPELDPILKNLASAYQKDHRFDDAEAVLLRVLKINRQTPGGSLRSAQTAVLLGSLAEAQRDTNLVSLLEKVADAKPAMSGGEYLFLVEAMGRSAKGNWTRAHQILQASLTVFQKQFPSEPLASFYFMAAAVARSAANNPETISYLRRMIDDLSAREGTESINMATPLKQLTELYIT
jgi:tetratricopeptide (TPR) repeat protein